MIGIWSAGLSALVRKLPTPEVEKQAISLASHKLRLWAGLGLGVGLIWISLDVLVKMLGR